VTSAVVVFAAAGEAAFVVGEWAAVTTAVVVFAAAVVAAFGMVAFVVGEWAAAVVAAEAEFVLVEEALVRLVAAVAVYEPDEARLVAFVVDAAVS